jgi:hypothetical protein
MAYYLQFDGADDYVSLPITPPSSSVFDITITVETGSLSPQRLVDGEGAGHIELNSGANNRVAFIAAFQAVGFQTINVNNGLALNTKQVFRVAYDGNDFFAEIDGVEVGRINIGARNVVFQTQYNIGRKVNNTRFFSGKIYSAQITLNGVSYDYNKQTLSGSNDTTLPDTVGGNDGTLFNFPTDNSQWVFFDDGGGAITADVDYTISSPTFTSTASVTLPAPIVDASFTIPAPTFTATGAATLPQPTADASFTVLAPTFAVTADATIPGFNASVSFAIPAPTFSGTASVTLPNPSADVAYVVSAPTFSVNADASLPQPSVDVAFSVNSPQFAASATATEPGFNASVNFTVNAPTFSGNASATLPQPDADVNFTVSAPTFSIFAIVGGIAIIVDDETNITLKAQSTNIDMASLSNNLEI